ncbi:MAG: glycosyltransferase family 4 protein [Alphaproteobacteria bacterium]|nr:glycosyltransferase family 4 protein [Alphaproteobacteria bacterium]MBT4085085.1 glycosyltransferase family 4 protein [Alphaproteobacteria bacterium]MBT4546100.1 glycosyltransferase family 4 protein [Alphaproteobacteria bacterium]MBT7744352.1 glycosyltransferase family 4 protein [Alphaproteobacteria bacterium]
MSKKPIVLQVLPALETGGVERTAVDMTKAIVDAGWTALVASQGGRMQYELERVGGEHIVMPLASKNPLQIHRNAANLTALVYDRGIDLIHARSRAPAWSALMAARRGKIPFVTTFHGTYGLKGPFKKLYNSVMTRGDRVIANSNFIADRVRTDYGVGLGDDAGRLIAVPRGIETTRFFNPAAVSAERIIQLAEKWRLTDGLPVIMLPGRLTRWKGQAVLIEALKHYGQNDVICVLVGDDQGRTKYREELEAMVRDLDLESVVRFVGNCTDMAAAYMLADVVVSASTDPEAFGRVAVEAQAMGRPVIATDHGGARETILPGKTGWLVPPGDALELASALRKAVHLDPDVRAEMASAGRAHVMEEYKVELMTARTMFIYRELLGFPEAKSAAEAEKT